MKPFVVLAVLAFSLMARADAPKSLVRANKLPRDVRVFVVDKDAPSFDKTVAIARLPRPASKNK